MNKAKRQHHFDHQRRRFLRDSAAASAGIAVAATLPGLAYTESDAQAEEETEHQKGYRLTSHIAAYYETMTS